MLVFERGHDALDDLEGGCGFFTVKDGRIVHQKGYYDQLSFFKAQGLPVPDDYLEE